ncbi:MAG: hypothetical protein JZD41_03120 [Thermoproteus sp.]|nr:hypothetical protein [Thermoproteus sp.]
MEGKRELDLDSLAAIRERRANCDNCPEKRIAKALDDIASENPGFGWSVIGECEKYLIIKPPNLEDVVRRFYS